MSRQSQYPKYDILGVDVDALTRAQAASYIIEWVGDTGRPAAVAVKPYVEFIDQAKRDPAAQQLLQNAELCLPDGVALQWAANFRYRSGRHWWDVVTRGASIVLRPSAITDPLPERFSGITFTTQLLEVCQSHKLTVFLIGSPIESNISRTATVLRQRFAGLDIVGTFPGHFSASGEKQLVEQLQQVKPDIILIGLGFPKQEQLATRLAGQLDHGFLIGEGGSFDYQELGGTVRRAPSWMQHQGLEWLWRLIQQPSRIGRQLAIPRFIWQMWRQKL